MESFGIWRRKKETPECSIFWDGQYYRHVSEILVCFGALFLELGNRNNRDHWFAIAFF